MQTKCLFWSKRPTDQSKTSTIPSSGRRERGLQRPMRGVHLRHSTLSSSREGLKTSKTKIMARGRSGTLRMGTVAVLMIGMKRSSWDDIDTHISALTALCQWVFEISTDTALVICSMTLLSHLTVWKSPHSFCTYWLWEAYYMWSPCCRTLKKLASRSFQRRTYS